MTLGWSIDEEYEQGIPRVGRKLWRVDFRKGKRDMCRLKSNRRENTRVLEDNRFMSDQIMYHTFSEGNRRNNNSNNNINRSPRRPSIIGYTSYYVQRTPEWIYYILRMYIINIMCWSWSMLSSNPTIRCGDLILILILILSHFYFPDSGQAVVSGVAPSTPRYVPSIFIAHRVQHSHCSSAFVECC